jgi:hypothetical protein
VRVVVSLRARSDILSIHSYLAERSLVAADRMLFDFRNGSMSFANSRSSVRIEANCTRRCGDF